MAKKKDEVPDEINKELESPKFGKPKTMTNSGYILDINEKDKKVDLQLYEQVQGTTIIEGLNLSKDVKLNDLEKGVVCEFKLNELTAKLSKTTVDYLAEQGINLKEIVQYEVTDVKIIDENA
tara:strand:- start:2344 stop:2709 length:366 start_codon:yes stop_codon:yes gene_type:complete